ncbi:MAG TPA: efflux RND transporter periplasmic adaptor subunit [Thermoanaerobaculia bacterium]|nr:efflux RND transporter periplasmic adaptor subunit [Thermoanaerobaculia bacterium]
MRPKLFQVLAPVAVLAGAVVVAGVLVAIRPDTERSAPADPGVLVAVDHAKQLLHRLDVVAQGTVLPASEIVVQPQVSGKVVQVHPRLAPGGLFRAGDLLYQIDPADYELAVDTARAAVSEAQARIELEQGRRRVAEREWELFRSDVEGAEQDPSLALREPQLRQAQAALDSAQARLAQTELDLERTKVRAPFHALVLAESVDPGQTVGPQSQTVQLVGTDAFWVRAAVETDRLTYVDVPGFNARTGSPVRVRLASSGQHVERVGRVERLLGDLDPAGRMARVLIEVPDPFGLAEPGGRGLAGESTQSLPLLLQSWVEVVIAGNREEQLLEVPRSWLREGDTLWIEKDGSLEVREIEIAWRREDSVLVAGGLEESDAVITSALATPVPGMRLRREARAGSGGEVGTSIALEPSEDQP